MGVGTMKTRFYLIIATCFLLILVALAYTSQGTSTPKTIATPTPTVTAPPTGTILVTIKNSIGIDRITVTNLNTGQIFKATLIDLTLNFNCTRSDYLEIAVTTQEGYEWNAWWFSPVGTFDQHNPYIFEADGLICVNNQIVMTPKCLIVEATPTPYTNSTIT